MLPTGHIAAGYLTGYALLKYFGQTFTQNQQTALLGWSAFFGFAPDIDVFFVFLKTRSMLVAGEENHRHYVSHAPVIWLAAGLLIYFFAVSEFVKYIGLLLWLGSWSHFLLDSIEHGVMWLWPFNKQVYAFKNRGVRKVIEEKNFFKHSLIFLKFYTTRLSFYLEILIILIAILVFFNL